MGLCCQGKIKEDRLLNNEKDRKIERKKERKRGIHKERNLKNKE